MLATKTSSTSKSRKLVARHDFWETAMLIKYTCDCSLGKGREMTRKVCTLIGTLRYTDTAGGGGGGGGGKRKQV